MFKGGKMPCNLVVKGGNSSFCVSAIQKTRWILTLQCVCVVGTGCRWELKMVLSTPDFSFSKSKVSRTHEDAVYLWRPLLRWELLLLFMRKQVSPSLILMLHWTWYIAHIRGECSLRCAILSYESFAVRFTAGFECFPECILSFSWGSFFAGVSAGIFEYTKMDFRNKLWKFYSGDVVPLNTLRK